MARHYLGAASALGLGLGVPLTIPAPAIDMATTVQRFGSSGSYVSGGGYVRRSQFGAQVLEVSWNNLNADDTNLLLTLNEWGEFIWDNPMAHRNVALPWLANHVYVDDVLPGVLGTSALTYTLGKFPNISPPRFKQLSGGYIGYPGRFFATQYDVSVGSTQTALQYIYIPDGYVARVWAVGSATGNVRLRLYNKTLPLNTPTTSLTEYPTQYEDVVMPHNHQPLVIQGTGELTLQSIQIRIVPEGAPVEPLTYSPGLGNSGMEFTEEGLQLVQHSAALDMQSATATWMETGWWK